MPEPAAPDPLRAALAGDGAAAASLWDHVEPIVRRAVRARWRGAQDADVDNLVQDLMIALLLGDAPKIRRWKGRQPLERWLVRVAHFAVIDRIRELRARPDPAIDGADALRAVPSRVPGPEAVAIGNELKALILGIADRLTRAPAEAIPLLLECATLAEAAHATGCDRTTVWRARSRVAKKLRTRWTSIHDDTSAIDEGGT